MNSNRIFSYIFIIASYLIFYCLYSFTARPTIVLERKNNDPQTVKNLKLATAFSYVFLIIYSINLFFLPPFYANDTYNYLFTEKARNIITIIVFLTSVIIFVFTLTHGKYISLSLKAPTKLFDGIYERIRHPQLLSLFLCWISISLFNNSLSVLYVSILSLIGLISLAKKVYFYFIEFYFILFCFCYLFIIIVFIILYIYFIIFMM